MEAIKMSGKGYRGDRRYKRDRGMEAKGQRPLYPLFPLYLLYPYFSDRFLAFSCRIFFRRRMFSGVTSTSSSSAMYSRACSSVIGLMGVRTMASSVPEARMLVSFFSLVGFTT